MKIYHFPPLTPARLVRESVVGYYLRLLKYPDPERPFSKLDPKTMPWPELQGLLLAHLRHRYTDYEARLASGEDRETLRHEIHSDAFHAFPFLRADPRPFPPPPVRLAFDEAAARLSTLTDLRHGLLEALNSPGGRGASRETLRGMLTRAEGEIAELTALLTQRRITEEGAICSFARTTTGGDYDWLGARLSPNHLRYAGFKCPGCGGGVYETKRPVPIGQGKRAILASCLCVTHLTPDDGGRRFEPVTLERWAGFLEKVGTMEEEETPPSRASSV